MISEKKEIKESFTKQIIQSLNIEFLNFIEGVIQNKPYDTLLFCWIDKLHSRGLTIEDSLKIIYRARRFYYLQPYRKNIRNSAKSIELARGIKKKNSQKSKVLITS